MQCTPNRQSWVTEVKYLQPELTETGVTLLESTIWSTGNSKQPVPGGRNVLLIRVKKMDSKFSTSGSLSVTGSAPYCQVWYTDWDCTVPLFMYENYHMWWWHHDGRDGDGDLYFIVRGDGQHLPAEIKICIKIALNWRGPPKIRHVLSWSHIHYLPVRTIMFLDNIVRSSFQDRSSLISFHPLQSCTWRGNPGPHEIDEWTHQGVDLWDTTDVDLWLSDYSGRCEWNVQPRDQTKNSPFLSVREWSAVFLCCHFVFKSKVRGPCIQ